jgi:hypothetical protein
MGIPADLSEKRRRAGIAGNRSRWGDGPRTVRIAELTSDQRRLVLALIEAASAANAERRAATPNGAA